jgi:hypothetical protein
MKSAKWFAISALALLIAVSATPAIAHPRVRTGVGVRFGFGVPVYRPYPYRFYGPMYPFYPFGFWGYWSDPRFGGQRYVQVERVNYGTVDFDVKPSSSQVYVDGKFMGTVNDLNGHGHKARLPGGLHEVRIVSPDGRSTTRTIYVAIGEKLKFNYMFD